MALQLPAGNRVFVGVKTFLKVVLLVVLALIAVKLLPFTFALGCVLAAAMVALLVLGASMLGVVFGATLLLAAALSPVWLPVLVLIGLIALLKRTTSGPANT
jgi:hypothetical protein